MFERLLGKCGTIKIIDEFKESDEDYFYIKNSNLSFLEQLFLKKAKKGLDRKLAPI